MKIQTDYFNTSKSNIIRGGRNKTCRKLLSWYSLRTPASRNREVVEVVGSGGSEKLQLSNVSEKKKIIF